MSPSHEKPLVSVVTPAYNSAPFIRETVESVMAQTFPDWEMVIVDDCSKDDTAVVAEGLARRDARVRFVRSAVNRGPGPTRNEALRLARGRYLAFLDADDLWDPDKLEKQVAFMRRGGHAFSYSSYRVVSEDGRPLGSVRNLPRQQTYVDMLKDTCVGCLTVMVDREQVGPLEFPSYRRNQDTALWLKILRSGVIARGIPEELATYRLVSSSNTSNKLKTAKAVWHVYRDQERLSLVASSWYFANYAWRGLRKHAEWKWHEGRSRGAGASGAPR